MALMVVGAVVALLVAYLWLRGHWFGAVVAWPVWLWIFWLAFLPPEPSRYQWILGAMISFVVAAGPCWIVHNRGPAYTVYPPR